MQFTGPFTLEEATDREWLITNGLGGYASATLCGLHSRRYHGLLVAALKPPSQRTLLVTKLEEVVTLEGQSYALATNQYPGTFHPHGFRYLTEFMLEGDTVISRFAAGNARIEKRVVMVFGENTTRVNYRNTGNVPFELDLTPLVNARDFHSDIRVDDIHFEMDLGSRQHGPQVHVRPKWLPDGYWLSADAGEWQPDNTWYRNMQYSWERRRGLTDVDNHFSPGHFRLSLQPGGEVTITLSTLPPSAEETARLIHRSPTTDYPVPENRPVEIAQLYRTAHSFLVQREEVGAEQLHTGRTIIAGYHWFGDWGRDTMIALPGLCLTTGRFNDAAEILRTFAAARRRGLLPNLFIESGSGEAYNSVDAALWFVHAVGEYFRITHDGPLVNELRPALEEIIHCYQTGTDFGIGMDSDGLINASSPGWQLTWMDAKVGDWVVTPRRGKPVEINALWYNALRVMEAFSKEFAWSDEYGILADKVRKSFAAFWYAEGEYLYDVLNDEPDRRLRPNQIFAASLPYSPLDLNRAKHVVETVERHLLTPYGLRTLAPQDPEYQGHYGGNQLERDGAYHQGTVWAWLIGPYIDAYLRVHGNSSEAKSICRKLLYPLLGHLWDAGIGSISEIFDGNPPYLPKGTISQAWSVAEVLRAWEKCEPTGSVKQESVE
ncbi:MAG: amylo-alpha-1,6-glucosidase [Armatimonadota bacterium]